MEFLKSSYVSTNSLNKIDWNSEMLLWEKYIGQTSFPFTMMCSQTLEACCYGTLFLKFSPCNLSKERLNDPEK